MFYHASNTGNIKELRPNVSNHNKPLVYLTTKRENSLVYLSNAVEKYCKETGFPHEGSYYKFCSYGFTKEGILELQEYWPDAVKDTYAGEMKRGYRLVKSLAKCSLVIYLIHPFFLEKLNLLGVTTISFSAIISVPVLTIIILVASYLVAFILNKIPYVNKICV